MMEISEDEMLKRNREIGRILQEARRKKDVPITTCAKLIHTSRRRYMDMEAGRAFIGIVELEVLMKFLEIPVQSFWYGEDALLGTKPVILEAVPGEKMHIIVDIQK
jgi:hypothetical protein